MKNNISFFLCYYLHVCFFFTLFVMINSVDMFYHIYFLIYRYVWIESATAYNHAYDDSGLFCIHASAHPSKVNIFISWFTFFGFSRNFTTTDCNSVTSVAFLSFFFLRIKIDVLLWAYCFRNEHCKSCKHSKIISHLINIKFFPLMYNGY